jgi:hypothetical protein
MSAINPSQHLIPLNVHTATKRAIATDVDPLCADDTSPVQQRSLFASNSAAESTRSCWRPGLWWGESGTALLPTSAQGHLCRTTADHSNSILPQYWQRQSWSSSRYYLTVALLQTINFSKGCHGGGSYPAVTTIHVRWKWWKHLHKYTIGSMSMMLIRWRGLWKRVEVKRLGWKLCWDGANWHMLWVKRVLFLTGYACSSFDSMLFIDAVF